MCRVTEHKISYIFILVEKGFMRWQSSDQFKWLLTTVNQLKNKSLINRELNSSKNMTIQCRGISQNVGIAIKTFFCDMIFDYLTRFFDSWGVPLNLAFNDAADSFNCVLLTPHTRSVQCWFKHTSTVILTAISLNSVRDNSVRMLKILKSKERNCQQQLQ